MLRSQDADCLLAIVKYIICHVGARKNKFCFDRCLKGVLKQRWRRVWIEWFLNRIYFVYCHQLNKLSASPPKLTNNATAKKLQHAWGVVWMQRFNPLHLMFRCSGPAWWETAVRSCTHNQDMICWRCILVMTSSRDLRLQPAHAFQKHRSFWKRWKREMDWDSKGCNRKVSIPIFGMDSKGMKLRKEEVVMSQTFIQPLASSTITSKGSSKDFTSSLLLSLLTQDSQLLMMAGNNIEYRIIYISTYIHNCFYHNATHLHEEIMSGPHFPPQFTDCLHPHPFCILLLLLLFIPSGHKKLTRKRKHLPNWTVNLLTS